MKTKKYGVGHQIDCAHTTSKREEAVGQLIDRLSIQTYTNTGSAISNPNTTWTTGESDTITVTTLCQSGETQAECEARHDVEVEFWQKIFPPA